MTISTVLLFFGPFQLNPFLATALNMRSSILFACLEHRFIEFLSYEIGEKPLGSSGNRMGKDPLGGGEPSNPTFAPADWLFFKIAPSFRIIPNDSPHPLSLPCLDEPYPYGIVDIKDA